MARPTIERKNLQDRSSAVAGVAVNSDVRPYIRGFEQRSKVPSFLSDLAKFTEGHAKDKFVKQAEEYGLQAETDVLNDSVDSERYQDNAIYRGAVLTHRGDLHGVRFRKGLAAGLEDKINEAAEAGVPFDPDAYISEQAAVLTESPEYGDPEYQRTFNAHLKLARTEVLAAADAFQEERLDAEALSTFGGVVYESTEGGRLDVAALTQRGEALNLTTNEIDDTIAQGIVDRMGAAKSTEEIEALQSQLKSAWEGSPAKLARHAATIEDAARINGNRIEAAQSKATVEEIRSMDDGFNEIADRIAMGEYPSLNELEAYRNRYGEGKAESRYQQLRGALRTAASSAADKARTAAEDEEYLTRGRQLLNSPQLFTEYNRMSTKERTAFQNDIFEPEFDMAQRAVLGVTQQIAQAQDAGDQAKVDELEDQLRHSMEAFRPLIDKANSIDYKPRAWDMFDNVNVASPQFRGVAAVYDAFRSVYGEDFSPSISDAAQARINQYNTLTKSYGMSHEDTVAYFKERGDIPLGTVRRDLMNTPDYDEYMGDALQALTAVSGGDEHPLVARDQLITGASYHMQMGATPEKAIELATQSFLENNEYVGGYWMPNKYVPKGFGAVLEEFMPQIKHEIINPQGDSDIPSMDGIDWDSEDDIVLVPQASSRFDGHMVVMNKRTHKILRNNDGEAVTIQPWKVIQAAARSQGIESEEKVREWWEVRRQKAKANRTLKAPPGRANQTLLKY